MISVIHPSEGKRKEGIVREALIDSQINANHRCVCVTGDKDLNIVYIIYFVINILQY